MPVSADGFHHSDAGGDLRSAGLGVESGLFDGAGEESNDRVEVAEDGAGESAGDLGFGLELFDQGAEVGAELVQPGGAGVRPVGFRRGRIAGRTMRERGLTPRLPARCRRLNPIPDRRGRAARPP